MKKDKDESLLIMRKALCLMFLPPILVVSISCIFFGGDSVMVVRLAVCFAMQLAVVIWARYKLERLRLKQKHVFDERERFFGMVCHDLRSPLAAIDMAVNLCVEQGYKAEPRFFAMMSRNIRMMASLIDDLLHLIVLNSESLPIYKSLVDVKAVIDDVVLLNSSKIEEKQIHLTVTVNCLECIADEKRLRQILNNLVANAIKYTPYKGVIHICSFRSKHHCAFYVEDSGPGIPVDKRYEIFKPFVQISKADIPSGTGLGLAIVRGLVQAHGGRVWVDPGFDKGSRFCFTMPFNQGVCI